MIARVVIPDLTALASESERLPWQRFRPGVDIHRLYGHNGGPAAALLRYQPGASIPRHRHTGYEHVLVLSGSQRDDNGRYAAGALVVNPPESVHSVISDEGCVALLIWEKPVALDL